MARTPKTNRWVTKTDVTRYHRCPYAFWQLDSRQVSFAQTITPLQAGLIEGGITFHQEIQARAVHLNEEEVDLPTLFARPDLTLYECDLPVLRNEEMGLRGLPDGVRTEGGALIPIEIKAHRDITPRDRLELAFYWLLLEPYRSRPPGRARGVLILRRGGDVEVEVDLLPRNFDEVRRIVTEIRQARRIGVKPRMCSCPVCAGPLREEVRRGAHHGKDLTLIWKIGRRCAEELEALGVATYSDLVDCDQAELLAGLREHKVSVSAAMLQGWCRHAESYARAEAVMFDSPCVPASFIALDLEYGWHTWLTGIYLVDGRRREFTQLWADTPADERRNLRHLGRLVAENPSLPLITYNGTGADLPELRKAGVRLRLTKLVESIVANHVDLRSPRPGCACRRPPWSAEVATYFGVRKLRRRWRRLRRSDPLPPVRGHSGGAG